jgi:outer membrane protein assembly factor BamB
VYAYGQSGAVLALSAADGTERWRSPGVVPLQPYPVVGDQGVVVYNVPPEDEVGEDPPRQLTAFDREDGTERWSTGLRGPRSPTPTVVDDTVFVADGDSRGLYPSGGPPRQVHALSMADGGERWSHRYDDGPVESALSEGGTATVTAAGDHVYFGLGFPTPAEYAGPDPTEDELAELEERVYEGPNVVALDRSDGSVVWRTALGDQARVFEPMVADADRLYAPYRGTDGEGRMRLYVLDRVDGSILGDVGTVENAQGVAAAGGLLFVHLGDAVRAFG